MDQNEPTTSIKAAHARLLESLPMADVDDFEDVARGFIGTLEDPAIRNSAGEIVWDASTFDFLSGDAPTSVNPSLWRQGQLVSKHGLFEVVEGLYQVRGFDLSVVSFVETDTGVIVIDPLLTAETGKAALGLYRRHRGDRPIVAVIYTHCHIDHFGGVFGVVTQEEVDSGQVQIVAPEGFLEHAIAENVYAGTAMSRRSAYMYGATLARGPKGQVGAGLGQSTSTGEPGILVPTLLIKETGESHTFDGVEVEFQMAPGTEAPAEMHSYFPRYRALCMAENATHTLHNLLTLRGAVVRDPHGWSGYLNEAIDLFGHKSDVMFAPHHWPKWGNEKVVGHLAIHRDLYGYLHDQTLRMINKGMTGAEIAEVIELPPAITKTWSTHGYYGSVSHNVKAIYQRYMGWFDGNPARLWPHPPQASAERHVAAIGGVERTVELAQEAYESGDFRWAATLLDYAVFTDTTHAGAKSLFADTLEQLGYGSENGTWRNFFLSGATELRDGNFGTPLVANSSTIMSELSPEQVFDSIAITVDGPRAWDLDLALDVTFSDLERSFRVTLSNGVLIYAEREPDGSAQLHLTLTKPRLLTLLTGDNSSDGLSVDGDMAILESLTGVLDPGDPDFNIVVP
ncbi:alkyl/aryl-sulfatase [Rhodococcus sp. NPDC058514]|uniref:alkyl/aryl-sulfatase n=1 Tax=unclassified Rhodococcus (in: high G+C Gram-positive bacteria) TaxID=192944 RepID=UPI003651AEF8